MTSEERINNENKFANNFWDTSYFDEQGIPEMMVKCCGGMSGSGDYRSMMAGCMKVCRWFPVIPVIFGIVLLLLGYYLDASIIRIFWMLFAGFIAVMGIFGLILMGKMRKMCC